MAIQAGAGAGAGSGAESMDKSEAKKEPEPKINNFGSATLHLPLTAHTHAQGQ